MVTAASTADLAIILVDARKGVLTQTRRHSFLAHQVGIPQLVVAVNKMDLVDYDQAVFEKIRQGYLAFAEQLGIQGVRFIPLSALNGDMVVDRGEALSWYDGPTLLDILEAAGTADSEAAAGFRFPVQYVCRPQESANPELHDYRGFMMYSIPFSGPQCFCFSLGSAFFSELQMTAMPNIAVKRDAPKAARPLYLYVSHENLSQPFILGLKHYFAGLRHGCLAQSFSLVKGCSSSCLGGASSSTCFYWCLCLFRMPHPGSVVD